MLGLADRGRVLDLFDMIMSGDAAAALAELSAQYADGADPLAVLRDLAEITHWVSVVKITPEAAEDPTISPDERARGSAMAQHLPLRVLARMWQMLLRALEEVAAAPNTMMAAEMAVIRLTHVADMPTPDQLIRELQKAPPPEPSPGGGGGNSGGGRPPASGGESRAASGAGPLSAPATSGPQGGTTQGHGSTAPALAPDLSLSRFATFDAVLELIRANRDVKLLVDVEDGLHLVSYQPGRIEFRPADSAPADLAQRLGSALQRWTGNRWGVSVVASGGEPTVAETRNAKSRALHDEALTHPMVQEVLARFPRAQITGIRSAEEIAAEAGAAALPEADDDWDPFEEERGARPL